MKELKSVKLNRPKHPGKQASIFHKISSCRSKTWCQSFLLCRKKLKACQELLIIWTLVLWRNNWKNRMKGLEKHQKKIILKKWAKKRAMNRLDLLITMQLSNSKSRSTWCIEKWTLPMRKWFISRQINSNSLRITLKNWNFSKPLYKAWRKESQKIKSKPNKMHFWLLKVDRQQREMMTTRNKMWIKLKKFKMQ